MKAMNQLQAGNRSSCPTDIAIILETLRYNAVTISIDTIHVNGIGNRPRTSVEVH